MSIGSGHSHSSGKRAEIRKLVKEIHRDVRAMREESAGRYKEFKEINKGFKGLTEVIGK